MKRTTETWEVPLRKAALCYPQPVAISASQVLRSRTAQEKVDACLKAAEILVRYLAALTLSSYRVRDRGEHDEGAFGDAIEGPLSFGTFLGIVQIGAKLKSQHPVAPYLAPFRKKKRGQPGKADEAIIALLELRNRLGHNLAAISDARARSILANDQPEVMLADALESLEGALSCPLFIIEDQQLAKGQIRARFFWLMGESRDPEPEEVTLGTGVHEPNAPYVSCGDTVLRLWPYLVWDILTQRQSYGLFVMDTVKDREIICQTPDGWELEINGEAVGYLKDTYGGVSDAAEQVATAEGETLQRRWRTEKQLRFEAAARAEGAMPWADFEPETLGWYARRLGADPDEKPEPVIGRRLFDGRTRFPENEINQARLLFGTEQVVRQVLKRDMVDLRMRDDGSVRWDERHTASTNLLTSLGQAVDFFARHIGLDDASMEGLRETEGTADYLAMREALVNLFVHQDYGDPSAAAQIELQPDRATFSNTGYSLVSDEQLIEGGRSQSRNPIIAQALRLIGFAELAGSGIRALQTVWRQERRRPPRFVSDREANSFTVHLDWRPVEDGYDALWKKRLGVRLTQEQVQILNLALSPEGVTKAEIASGTGLNFREVLDSLRYLQVQGLLDERDGRYHIKEHLKELLE